MDEDLGEIHSALREPKVKIHFLGAWARLAWAIRRCVRGNFALDEFEAILSEKPELDIRRWMEWSVGSRVRASLGAENDRVDVDRVLANARLLLACAWLVRAARCSTSEPKSETVRAVRRFSRFAGRRPRSLYRVEEIVDSAISVANARHGQPGFTAAWGEGIDADASARAFVLEVIERIKELPSGPNVTTPVLMKLLWWTQWLTTASDEFGPSDANRTVTPFASVGNGSASVHKLIVGSLASGEPVLVEHPRAALHPLGCIAIETIRAGWEMAGARPAWWGLEGVGADPLCGSSHGAAAWVGFASAARGFRVLGEVIPMGALTHRGGKAMFENVGELTKKLRAAEFDGIARALLAGKLSAFEREQLESRRPPTGHRIEVTEEVTDPEAMLAEATGTTEALSVYARGVAGGTFRRVVDGPFIEPNLASSQEALGEGTRFVPPRFSPKLAIAPASSHFDNAIGNRDVVIVVAPSGCGKTLLIDQTARRLASSYLTGNHIIPLVARLRDLETGIRRAHALGRSREAMAEEGLEYAVTAAIDGMESLTLSQKTEARCASAWLAAGALRGNQNIVLLLDALDETSFTLDEADGAVARAMDYAFQGGREADAARCAVVASTQPHELGRWAPSSQFVPLSITPFDTVGVRDFVERALADDREGASRVISEVGEDGLHPLASRPLLLALLCRAVKRESDLNEMFAVRQGDHLAELFEYCLLSLLGGTNRAVMLLDLLTDIGYHWIARRFERAVLPAGRARNKWRQLDTRTLRRWIGESDQMPPLRPADTADGAKKSTTERTHSLVNELVELRFLSPADPDGLSVLPLDESFLVWLAETKVAALGDKSVPDTRLHAEVLYGLGLCTLDSGYPRRALDYFERSRRVAPVTDERVRQLANRGSGNALSNLGDRKEAMGYYTAALNSARAVNDSPGTAAALGMIGKTYLALGDFRNASLHLDEQYELAKVIGDRESLCVASGNLGNLRWREHKFEESVEYYHKCLLIAEELGAARYVATALGNLANRYGDLGKRAKNAGNIESAAVYLEKAGEQLIRAKDIDERNRCVGRGR